MDGMHQRATEGGDAISMDGWADIMLLGNCSCVALISYIHVTMQNLHFHHP
jgi:hypothetical protein